MDDWLKRIEDGTPTAADLEYLREILASQNAQVVQWGKYNINIGQGQEIQVGDRLYVEINDEAVRAIATAIHERSQFLTDGNLEAIDFQPYLQSIINDEEYQEWQDVYTPTTVEARKPAPTATCSPRLRLRAETVKLPQDDQIDREPENQERVEQGDVLTELRNYAADHVLLIGKPGSGKSTSLERLLWEEADNALQNPAAKIPVLVKLRRCTSTIENLIQDFFSRHQLTLEITDIEYLLRQRKLLLLLDGLNELPDTFRTEVANFRDRHRKTTPMIVSTRELSVGGTLGIDKVLKMLPLTEPQIRKFVRGYLGEESDRLFQQLRGDRLQKFAETPLLLWMLCRVFVQNGQVPTNLGLAFREFTQLYDQQIQEDAPTESRDQWPKLLRYLAFALMQGKTPVEFRLSMPREEAEDLLVNYLQQEGRVNARECAECWLQDLIDYHLLQPIRQPNLEEQIEFRHQLIQEYYAAEYLLRLLPNLSDEQLKRDYLNLLKWTEPIALMLALVDEEDQALRVIKLALDDVDLILGAKLAGTLQSTTFQEYAINWLTQLRVNKSLKIRLLGKTRSQFVISQLLNFLEEPDINTRSLVIEELGAIGGKRSVTRLIEFLDNTDSSVKGLTQKAAEALGEIGDELALPALLNLLATEPYGDTNAVCDAVVRIGGEQVIPDITEILKNNSLHPFVRANAASVLGSIGSPIALQDLLDVLKYEEDVDIRFTVARSLGDIGHESAIPYLREVLTYGQFSYYNDEYDIVSIVKDSLQKIGGDHAILSLLYAFRSSDPHVRNSVAFTICYSRDIQPYLNCLAKYPAILDVSLSWKEILTSKTSEELRMDVLLDALNHPNDCIRLLVAVVLGKIGDRSTISRLVGALMDLDPRVRSSVVQAIGSISDTSSSPELFDALKGQEGVARYHTNGTLSNVGDKSAIPRLLNALKDQNSEVRSRAAKTLGDIGSTALSGLWKLAVADNGETSSLLCLDIITGIQKHAQFYNHEIAYSRSPKAIQTYLGCQMKRLIGHVAKLVQRYLSTDQNL